jgi:hypothetical protein
MPIDVIKWVKGWKLGKVFKSAKDFVDKVAVSVTQGIKTAAEGTIAQTISVVIDEALHTHLAEDALAVIKIAAMKALAVELAIKGLPDNPSGDDILAFEKEVFEAITGKTPQAQSKVWTTFAAQLYEDIHEAIGENTTLTYAQIVILIEKAYQQFKEDQAEAA